MFLLHLFEIITKKNSKLDHKTLRKIRKFRYVQEKKTNLAASFLKNSAESVEQQQRYYLF